MKINNIIFVSLLSALFIAAGTFTPGYAVDKNPPPTKIGKGDCTPAQCQRVFADAGQTCTNAKDTKPGDGFCDCGCYDEGGSRKIKK